ncbi:MAG: twin-arginine translocase TatA/TatE family subunit [Kofleriaceae bacterium]
MFGIGGSEILVILVVALLFLGPDKLPDAAKQISKGIRDLKKQSKILTQTIENDETIGGALRDIKSALRGDEIPPRPPIKKQPNKIEGDGKPELAAAEAKPDAADAEKTADVATGIINDAAAKLAPPPTEAEIAARDQALHEADIARIKLPDTAGEPNAEDSDKPDLKGTHDAEELAKLIKPPVGETAAREPADKNG